MKNYYIHLIRTGTTSVEEGRRFTGQLDLPVCREGMEALEQLRERYSWPDAGMVYSSPLLRCRQTAEVLYPEADLVLVEDLADMDLGEFQGRSFQELRQDPDFSRWLDNSQENPPPGGEDLAAFTGRIVRALEQVLRQMMAEGTDSAAVVTHGGVIMTLLAAMALPRLPLHQWATPNGTGYTLRTSAQMWMRDQSVEIAALIPGETEEAPEL